MPGSKLLHSEREGLASGTEVKRKIRFYFAHPGIAPGTNEVKPFDPYSAAEHIAALTELDKQFDRRDGNLTFCRIFGIDRYPRLQLSTVRMSVIPEGFDKRDSSSWRFTIADEQGMMEHSHMMFFPNNIVGVEHNHYGPGIGRLEEYLRHKAASVVEPNLRFKMLIDRDFEEKLRNMTSLRELRIRVSRRQIEGASSEEISSEDEDPLRVLEAMREFGEAPEYEIAWKNRVKSRQHIGRWFRSVGEAYLRRYDTEDKSAKLLVVGDDEEGHRQEVNVLRQRLVFDERAIRLMPADRSVTPESGFEAIWKAYKDNQERIQRAGAIHLVEAP